MANETVGLIIRHCVPGDGILNIIYQAANDYESPLGVTRSFTPGPLQFKAPSKVSETSLYVCPSKVSENISKSVVAVLTK